MGSPDRATSSSSEEADGEGKESEGEGESTRGVVEIREEVQEHRRKTIAAAQKVGGVQTQAGEDLMLAIIMRVCYVCY